VHHNVFFAGDITNIIRGIRRAIQNSDRSGEYKLGSEDTLAAIGDICGIGEIDENGDLCDISWGYNKPDIPTYILPDKGSRRR